MDSFTDVLGTADGDLAYEVRGPGLGPLVVCLPGMGDVRSVYRSVAPVLAGSGWRVAVMDLPGHGASTAGAIPSQVRIGEHAARLAETLGGPAIVVGHSYTPDSALVATQVSPVVVGAVCIAPWTTTPTLSLPMRALTGFVTRQPWAWGAFYRSLYKTRPEALAGHVREVKAALGRPHGTDTLYGMAMGQGKDAVSRRGDTTCPAVVVMGDRDPDFTDPAAQAQAFAEQCGGLVVMAPGAGHYPHAETPEVVITAIRDVGERAGITHPAPAAKTSSATDDSAATAKVSTSTTGAPRA